jgi:hypothetical protein
MKLRTTILGSALAAAMLLAAGGAGAVTTLVIPLVGGAVSGVNTEDEIGLVKGGLLTSHIYDFTFSVEAPLAPGATVSTDLQAQAQSLVDGVPTGVAEVISFSLYSGTPGVGTPTLIGTSTPSISSTLTEALGIGSYFIQITPAQIAKSGETPSGTVIGSAVPEPATWAAMFLGFGGIGASMRKSRRRLAAATA